MKTFYIEVSITYTDDTDGEEFVDVENYSIITSAKTIVTAKKRALKEAARRFDEEINEGFSDIKVHIDDCYETSEDARSS